LGIEVAGSVGSISLSQQNYTSDLLKDSTFLGSKPIDHLMDPNKKLMIDQGELLVHPNMYKILVGKLNYLPITAPDISFAVNVVSQFLLQ
jgi:hypothetical protein